VVEADAVGRLTPLRERRPPLEKLE
jgi:hypothetical protein